MQRKGRKGQAYFRVIVQESRLSPASGKVVAYLGGYDPHTKDVTIDTEKVSFYLDNGAQPSESVARLLRSQKITLPSWVSIEDSQKRSIKNPEKLRKNQPKEEAEEAPAEPEPSSDEADSADAKEAAEVKDESGDSEKAEETSEKA